MRASSDDHAPAAVPDHSTNGERGEQLHGGRDNRLDSARAQGLLEELPIFLREPAILVVFHAKGLDNPIALNALLQERGERAGADLTPTRKALHFFT